LRGAAPELWIIAGANGSGKSTAYSQAAIELPAGSIWIINPDELAKRIAEHDGVPLNPDANIAAVTRIEAWLYASVEATRPSGWRPYSRQRSTVRSWRPRMPRASSCG
jgi:predicted ABC-type ATPase